MMKFKTIALALTLCLLPAASTAAGQGAGEPSIDEVIRRFAVAESENKIARNNYTFTQDYELLTLGEGGSITGRFKRVSDIVFDDRGNRVERISYFPVSTLRELSITPQDMQDLAGVQPFALTAEDLPKYNIKYSGKEKIDELTTYVFDVKPKQIRKGERYFDGRIWVDDRDLQIVKAAGKGVPEDDNNRYPHFETYRENVDGRYWFPTYTYADDVLEFKRGGIHIRMTVRYTNYKKFTTGIRIEDGGEAVPEGETKNPQPNQTTKTPAPEVKKQENPDSKKQENKEPAKTDPKKEKKRP